LFAWLLVGAGIAACIPAFIAWRKLDVEIGYVKTWRGRGTGVAQRTFERVKSLVAKGEAVDVPSLATSASDQALPRGFGITRFFAHSAVYIGIGRI
jgi:hypothetical protein